MSARTPTAQDSAPDGLAEHVREVRRARARLGADLEQLNYEVRAEMGQKVEKFAWKTLMLGSVLVSVVGTRKALTAGWRALQHDDPPTNPADPGTGWGAAIAWTLATAMAAAAAKLVTARATAAGWQKATGTLPPDMRH